MKETHTHCFVAGQSGGHILPCITLAHEILNKHPKDTILFFTTGTPLDRELTASLGTQFDHIQLPLMSVQSHNPFKLILFGIKLITSFFTALYYLIRVRPQSITSTGGICTIPVACAAYLIRIPIDLYELNVLPGKTTYFLAHMARTIYCCFERTFSFLPKNRCKKTGYPVRFFNEEQHSRIASCNLIGLDPQKKTILVLGGSQGSVFINHVIKQWVTHTSTTSHIQIIHQIGAYDTTNWKALYSKHAIPAVVFPFNHHMEQFYAASDVIICRSGAGTLFEVLYFHTPCITIPLELHSNAHQVHNAFTITQEYPELFTVLTQDTLAQHPLLLEKTISEMLALESQKAVPHTQARDITDAPLNA